MATRRWNVNTPRTFCRAFPRLAYVHPSASCLHRNGCDHSIAAIRSACRSGWHTSKPPAHVLCRGACNAGGGVFLGDFVLHIGLVTSTSLFIRRRTDTGPIQAPGRIGIVQQTLFPYSNGTFSEGIHFLVLRSCPRVSSSQVFLLYRFESIG
jgi:hypothetical protein